MKKVSKASLVLFAFSSLFFLGQGMTSAWGIWFEGDTSLPYIGYELIWTDDSPMGAMFGIFYWVCAGIAAFCLRTIPVFAGIAWFTFCKNRKWI
ncbi:hypothetical protein [Microbulbifer epialgicus]|uniref:Uncharacterized protein n=1 Tax=Microbulbifer epialgicus TaxID=393907 RepID=A0ABV4NU32_9GAMM